MFEVYLDDELLYYPNDSELCIIDPVLDMALNDSGSFEFGLPVTNPLYDKIFNRKSMIKILKNKKEIFQGEVRESDKDIYKTKQVYCVGELAFFFDSIQPQGKYQNHTIRQFLETLINNHNGQVEERKRFEIGIVTVTDSNNSIYRFTNRETTLDAIRQKLCEPLNGYIKIRKENGKRYIDFLKLDDYGKKCNQTIEFGVNLIDYAENLNANDIVTAVIPLGAKLETSPVEGLEAYVDITSVNDGKDYVYIPEAVERFGWVRSVQQFDDVTLPENLKAKGAEWLQSAQYEDVVLNVTAVDLSLTDEDVDNIELGDKVHALATPLGMNTWFPVQNVRVPLQNIAGQTFELGNTSSRSYTDDVSKRIDTELESVKKVQSSMQSAIDNATQMILGSKGGYKLSEYDENNRWVRDLYMDAPNKDDAVNILVVTHTGIGFSRNGYDGPYETAWTIDGSFNANFITAGTLDANLIKSGKISGRQNPTVYFDLDNGKISGSSLVDPYSSVKAEIAERTYNDEKYRGFILYDKKYGTTEIVPIAGISRTGYSTDTDVPSATFFCNDDVYVQSHGNNYRNNVISMTKQDGVGHIIIKRAVGENEGPALEQETVLNTGSDYLQLRKLINAMNTLGYLHFSENGTLLGFQAQLSNTAIKQSYIQISAPAKDGTYKPIIFVISNLNVAQITEKGFVQEGVCLLDKINEQELQIAGLNTRVATLESKVSTLQSKIENLESK